MFNEIRERRSLPRAWAEVLVGLALVVGSVTGTYVAMLHFAAPAPRQEMASAPPPAHSVGNNNPATFTPPTSSASLPSFTMAGVHKGEGVESPLIRELIARPAIAQGTAYRFTGDTQNAKAVKAWADHTAAVLATRAGFVDWKFGREVRIAKANTVAFVITREKEGLHIVQYSRSALMDATTMEEAHAQTPAGLSPHSTPSTKTSIAPVRTYVPATTVVASQFLAGDSGLPLLPRALETTLYVYNP